MLLTIDASLAGSWKDTLDTWVAEQEEFDAELGHATLVEELQALSACGLLDETRAAASDMQAVLNAGHGVLPCHLAGTLVLFHALGLNPFNPLTDGADDATHLGARPLERPVWTWFAGSAAAARVVEVTELAGVSMAEVVEACTWGPATRAALERHRSRADAGQEWPGDAAPPVPDTWHGLVLQRAGASLGPSGVPKWLDVMNSERAALRSDLDFFWETGGIPVFEDQLLALAASLPGGDDPTRRWRFRSIVRGARRAENRKELQSLSLPRPLEEVLLTWGPTIWPRAAAIGEARLELVSAWRNG